MWLVDVNNSTVISQFGSENSPLLELIQYTQYNKSNFGFSTFRTVPMPYIYPYNKSLAPSKLPSCIAIFYGSLLWKILLPDSTRPPQTARWQPSHFNEVTQHIRQKRFWLGPQSMRSRVTFHHGHNLFGQSAWFWRTSVAETQQQARRADTGNKLFSGDFSGLYRTFETTKRPEVKKFGIERFAVNLRFQVTVVLSVVLKDFIFVLRFIGKMFLRPEDLCRHIASPVSS